jgi:hypothetical protein
VTGHKPSGSNPAAEMAPATNADQRGYFKRNAGILCTAPSLPIGGDKSNTARKGRDGFLQYVAVHSES